MLQQSHKSRVAQCMCPPDTTQSCTRVRPNTAICSPRMCNRPGEGNCRRYKDCRRRTPSGFHQCTTPLGTLRLSCTGCRHRRQCRPGRLGTCMFHPLRTHPPTCTARTADRNKGYPHTCHRYMHRFACTHHCHYSPHHRSCSDCCTSRRCTSPQHGTGPAAYTPSANQRTLQPCRHRSRYTRLRHRKCCRQSSSRTSRCRSPPRT